MSNSDLNLPTGLLDRIGTDLERVSKWIKGYLDPESRREHLRALARESDFDHIRADQRCEIATSGGPAGCYYAACVTHDVESEDHWRTTSEARQYFLCDRGRRWNFIIHHRDDHVRPRMLDLTELAAEVRCLVENGGVVPSTGEEDLIALYRYVDDDVRIPLEITQIPLPEGGSVAPARWRPDLRDANRYLVVVHAEGEEPNLTLPSALPSPANHEATSGYDVHYVTYLQMVLVAS